MALLGSCNGLFQESGAVNDQSADVFSQVLNGEMFGFITILISYPMFCKGMLIYGWIRRRKSQGDRWDPMPDLF